MSSGLIDTSVIIDWTDPDVVAALPDESAVCTVTMAELAAGPHLASSPSERARRQARLQEVESLFEPLPLDGVAARSFGQVVAAVTATGRSPRSRFVDLLIAAIAHANHLPLYTRNPGDFVGLHDLLTIVAV